MIIPSTKSVIYSIVRNTDNTDMERAYRWKTKPNNNRYKGWQCPNTIILLAREAIHMVITW